VCTILANTNIIETARLYNNFVVINYITAN
jgi:hypothetical protein